MLVYLSFHLISWLTLFFVQTFIQLQLNKTANNSINVKQHTVHVKLALNLLVPTDEIGRPTQHTSSCLYINEIINNNNKFE